MEFETWLFLVNVFLLGYSIYLTIDIVKLKNDIDSVKHIICTIYEHTSVGEELRKASEKGGL